MGRATPPQADLERAWVRALYRWWDHYDREYLRGALRRPLIDLADGRQRLGEWDPAPRRIRLSRRHLAEAPWTEVLDTLRHEMAHQFVWEVLAAGDEAPHGPAFQQACRRLRCDPRATARPAAGDEVRVTRVVRKLLSLGESPNENEAQAAVSKAQRLLLEYNVELVEHDAQRGFERRQLGRVKARHPAWELWLGMILNEYFFVEVLWSRSYDTARDLEGTVLEVYGTPTNLDMADYVHGYLAQLLPRLWADYRKVRGLADNRERMRYYAGVLQGFHGELGRQRRALAATPAPQAVPAPTATRALVWQGDPRLQAYYRYHNPRVRTRQTGGVAASEAFHHGLAEGRRVRLRQPVAQGGFGGYLEGR